VPWCSIVIRTRRIPFLRSRPSTAMLAVPVSCAIIGAVLPFTLLSRLLGFTSLPLAFFLVLIGMILSCLMLAELAKDRFYRSQQPPPRRRSSHAQKRRRRIRRRASRARRD
jgi:Mg2+-importing ATPase